MPPKKAKKVDEAAENNLIHELSRKNPFFMHKLFAERMGRLTGPNDRRSLEQLKEDTKKKVAHTKEEKRLAKEMKKNEAKKRRRSERSERESTVNPFDNNQGTQNINNMNPTGTGPIPSSTFPFTRYMEFDLPGTMNTHARVNMINALDIERVSSNPELRNGRLRNGRLSTINALDLERFSNNPLSRNRRLTTEREAHASRFLTPNRGLVDNSVPWSNSRNFTSETPIDGSNQLVGPSEISRRADVIRMSQAQESERFRQERDDRSFAYENELYNRENPRHVENIDIGTNVIGTNLVNSGVPLGSGLIPTPNQLPINHAFMTNNDVIPEGLNDAIINGLAPPALSQFYSHALDAERLHKLEERIDNDINRLKGNQVTTEEAERTAALRLLALGGNLTPQQERELAILSDRTILPPEKQRKLNVLLQAKQELVNFKIFRGGKGRSLYRQVTNPEALAKVNTYLSRDYILLHNGGDMDLGYGSFGGDVGRGSKYQSNIQPTRTGNFKEEELRQKMSPLFTATKKDLAKYVPSVINRYINKVK